MKAALVTGASSGIGRSTAAVLAGRGYAVAVMARRAAGLATVAREIGARGGRVLVIVGDVSVPADVERAVRETAAAFGGISVLVNNAGYAPLRTTAEFSVEEWRRIVDTNLSATFYGIRAVWPVMKAGGGGVIVNVSSMSARDPFMGLGAYGAAKAGVNLLTLATAREGAAAGIRVHGVAPGAVDTPMLRGVLGDATVDPAAVLSPEAVAEMIAAMAEGAARFTSGETVYVHAGPA
jgi:NAD(P)-dependent dehydrogenase (short-subunit alcohol dehydrogenase family)